MPGCLSIMKGTSNQFPKQKPIKIKPTTATTPIAPPISLLSKSTHRLPPLIYPKPIPKPTTEALETCRIKIPSLPPFPCPEPIPKPTTEEPENCSIKIPSNFSPLIRLLHSIMNQPIVKLKDPPLRFDLSIEAAIHNKKVLESVNNSVDRLIHTCSPSILNYGSEFKSVSILQPLLHRHRNWENFKKILEDGSTFPLEPIDEETRQKDFSASLTYGNHKSAMFKHDVLMTSMSKESKRGWVLPLLPDHASQLAGATVSPMGIVHQSTINEKGEIIPSNRVTHDLSFPGKFSTQSVNSRTKMQELSPCQYGHMFLRCIHYIMQIRLTNPNLPIVMQKVDFKSAYRRVHLNASTATQCMSQIKHPDHPHIVLLPIRLTFGGSACPSEWCVVSEMVTDLANRILNHKPWDPAILKPTLADKVPTTSLLPQDIPFAQGRPLLMVDPSIAEETGQADVYVDDICTIGLLRDEEAEYKLKLATLLALEVVGRTSNTSDPSTSIIRENLVSLNKLQAEAGLSERKILLGWELDTRQLTVRLTQEKYTTWTRQIHEILTANGKTSKKVLEKF